MDQRERADEEPDGLRGPDQAPAVHGQHRLLEGALRLVDGGTLPDGYQEELAKGADTALKVNISWHFFFPGSSTTPWQLEGVIRALKQDGFDPSLIHACHNRTVVIDAHLGERENKQLNVVEAHGLRKDTIRQLLVMLERLPRTPNGKLDRRALPAPEQDAYVYRHIYKPKDLPLIVAQQKAFAILRAQFELSLEGLEGQTGVLPIVDLWK